MSTKILQLRSALESAKNGLQWYRDMYPNAASGADDEMMAAIDEALSDRDFSVPGEWDTEALRLARELSWRLETTSPAQRVNTMHLSLRKAMVYGSADPLPIGQITYSGGMLGVHWTDAPRAVRLREGTPIFIKS